jgi:hypothetical protein
MLIMAGRKWKCRAQTLIVPSCFSISFSSFWRARFQESNDDFPYDVLVGPKSDYFSDEATCENQPRNGNHHDL